MNSKRARWLRQNHSGIVVDRRGSRAMTKTDYRHARKAWDRMSLADKEDAVKAAAQGKKFVQRSMHKVGPMRRLKA